MKDLQLTLDALTDLLEEEYIALAAYDVPQIDSLTQRKKILLDRLQAWLIQHPDATLPSAFMEQIKALERRNTGNGVMVHAQQNHLCELAEAYAFPYQCRKHRGFYTQA